MVVLGKLNIKPKKLSDSSKDDPHDDVDPHKLPQSQGPDHKQCDAVLTKNNSFNPDILQAFALLACRADLSSRKQQSRHPHETHPAS